MIAVPRKWNWIDHILGKLSKSITKQSLRWIPRRVIETEVQIWRTAGREHCRKCESWKWPGQKWTKCPHRSVMWCSTPTIIVNEKKYIVTSQPRCKKSI